MGFNQWYSNCGPRNPRLPWTTVSVVSQAYFFKYQLDNFIEVFVLLPSLRIIGAGFILGVKHEFLFFVNVRESLFFLSKISCFKMFYITLHQNTIFLLYKGTSTRFLKVHVNFHPSTLGS
jgi:hypothetical protein